MAIGLVCCLEKTELKRWSATEIRWNKYKVSLGSSSSLSSSWWSLFSIMCPVGLSEWLIAVSNYTGLAMIVDVSDQVSIETLGSTLVSAALSICIGSDWTSWPQTTRYPLSITSESGSRHDSLAVMLLLTMMKVCCRFCGSRATAATDRQTDRHTNTHTERSFTCTAAAVAAVGLLSRRRGWRGRNCGVTTQNKYQVIKHTLLYCDHIISEW